jgi:phosphate transport system protein
MIERHFHEELRALNQKLGEMGALVERRTHEAMRALIEHRHDLAEMVATGDQEVNELELEVDDMTLRLLALQHPVASDLRHVRSAIKVNTDLERIGDQAVNIAEATLRLITLPPLRPTIDLARLSEISEGMVHDAMRAFLEQDVALARSVLLRDDDADASRDSIFRVLLTHMMADPGTVERALGLIFVARSLERIADHATNIAEDLIFLVEGRVVRHHADQRDAR